ncbi:protein PAT1 homolog 1 isoform X3 [Polypterus senegalus]|uniref:protein PAT1 homolog 1 isoform X3 n=1 Tax=Polypterus senegalus TaxID=55291 RepID=UPI00196469C9|nr:protein PAT1 homolog 1 isoform X3 [Polypterus senegalus]
MFRFQSLEDCPLEEEGEGLHGLVDEDDDIDQFNDDTFGAGAVDDDWQEEHERLAELEEKVSGGHSSPPQQPLPPHNLSSSSSKADDLADRDRYLDSLLTFGGGANDNLAESFSKLVMNAGCDFEELSDPAVMRATLPQPRTPLNSSIWENPMGFGNAKPLMSQVEAHSTLAAKQDSPLMSIIKEVGLPKRSALGQEEGRDLSERAPPPRSSSPIIGSPPVRAIPIGTPPKQPLGHNLGQHQQILCPTPIHVRAPLPQQFPSAFNDRMSPNQLLNVTNSPLCAHPFSSNVPPVLSQLHRAQMIGAAQPGHMSPSHFARVSRLAGNPLTAVNPKLLQGRMGQMMSPVGGGGGFRPFFSPAPPHPPQCPPGHLHNLHSQQSMFRPDTTHLHPQHRRLLHQRQQQQSRSQQRRGQNGTCDRTHRHGTSQDRCKRDPYSNLMTSREKEWVCRIQMMQLQSTDPYLDDYYYQNYFEKLEKRPSPLDSNGDMPKKEHTKLITPQVAKLEHTYRPVQFAGSLGKLTVSSVNNPRKMIDAVVTTRSDDEEKREKQVWNKRRQILYTIEKTYSLLLDIQDFQKKYVQTPDDEKEALLEQRKSKIMDMFENLRGKSTDARNSRFPDDHLVQIMCIRKGKRLIGRLITYLSIEQAGVVLTTIARNLPYILKKDGVDEVLPWLIEPCSLVIHHLPSGQLTDLLQDLSGLSGETELNNSNTNQQLTRVLQSKFGLTLLYFILSEGERLQSSDDTSELMEDNRWTELVFGVTRELLKIPAANLARPAFTPPSLLSLFSRYVDRQRLNLLEDKLQLSSRPR